jgi:hypothetical protein
MSTPVTVTYPLLTIGLKGSNKLQTEQEDDYKCIILADF